MIKIIKLIYLLLHIYEFHRFLDGGAIRNSYQKSPVHLRKNYVYNNDAQILLEWTILGNDLGEW
jgi:hypothetical protein